VVNRVRRGRRSIHLVEAERTTLTTLQRFGQAIRDARRRRRLTQAALATLVGLSQSAISRIELGQDRRLTIATCLALTTALGLRMTIEAGRDWKTDPDDAGHLSIQELLLRLARGVGAVGTFEVPIRPSGPAHSIDVFVRDDARRRLFVEEAWNTLGDIGAGVRSFDRKVAAALEVGVAIGGDRPYDVHGVWVVRATRRNRDLVARYPEVFASKFPGSSARWVAALMTGSQPPREPGLVWADAAATGLFAWRRSDPQRS
jgi:HTH-type transcriptional regulator / antitoxin HipB